VATVIACVDGFNLYHGLRDKYRRRYLWFDLEHFLGVLCGFVTPRRRAARGS